MRVRIKEEADGFWRVETKHWYQFHWQYEKDFGPYDQFAYEKALAYAERMKNLRVEEIK